MGPAAPMVQENFLFFAYLGLKPCVLYFLHKFFASVFLKEYLCSLYEGIICAQNL